jgi:DNA-binding LytR/AlgR family response regulator
VRVLVVDDEKPARDRLIRMLARIEGVSVAGEARDGEEAARMIAELAPDAVLLDVNMPRLDGMSLALEHLGALPAVVFVTAYDDHAVRAFEAGAVDYLVKPVRQERLERALERARERGPARAAGRETDAGIEALLRRLAGAGAAEIECRISVAQAGTVRFFDARQVSRFWSSDKYTLFCHGGDELMLEETLGALERRLAPHRFVRVHRSELINLSLVEALHHEDGIHEVELADGQRARVSRRSLAALRRALGLQ